MTVLSKKTQKKIVNQLNNSIISILKVILTKLTKL
jgi:hypothetical protein